jgi:hypothetical protein
MNWGDDQQPVGRMLGASESLFRSFILRPDPKSDAIKTRKAGAPGYERFDKRTGAICE